MKRAARLLVVLALVGCGRGEGGESKQSTAAAPGGCREVAKPERGRSPPSRPRAF